MAQPPTNPENTRERRRRKTPWWEIAAVIVAFGLLVINIFLWRSTKKSADAATNAARTAAEQLDAWKDSQSAQLVVEKFDAKLVPVRINVLGHIITNPKELEIQVAFTIKNAGPSVANEILIEKNGGDFDLRTTPVKYPPWKWDTPLPLSSGRSLAPSDAFVYQPELPTVPIEGVSTGGRRVYFTIGISWRDIFGRSHIVTQCGYYSPITPPLWRGECYWTPTPKNH